MNSFKKLFSNKKADDPEFEAKRKQLKSLIAAAESIQKYLLKQEKISTEMLQTFDSLQNAVKPFDVNVAGSLKTDVSAYFESFTREIRKILSATKQLLQRLDTVSKHVAEYDKNCAEYEKCTSSAKQIREKGQEGPKLDEFERRANEANSNVARLKEEVSESVERYADNNVDGLPSVYAHFAPFYQKYFDISGKEEDVFYATAMQAYTGTLLSKDKEYDENEALKGFLGQKQTSTPVSAPPGLPPKKTQRNDYEDNSDYQEKESYEESEQIEEEERHTEEQPRRAPPPVPPRR